MSRVLVAAKQAPVWHERVDGRVEAKLSAGGTGSVVGDLAGRLAVTVVGSAATQEDAALTADHPEGVEVRAASGKPITVRMVRHDEETLAPQRYGVSTELLWQTMHGLWDGWRAPSWDSTTRLAWRSLHDLNDDFATALGEQAGVFLVHDYQLCLLPAKLRRKHPDAPVLYFHHIAWPGPETLEILPGAIVADLLRGLLAADVVAFFAQRWCRNFLHCVAALLPEAEVGADTVRLDGRTTRIVALPLSFSPDALSGLDRSWPEDLASWAGDHQLLVHSGRSDPTKNAHRAVEAFLRSDAPANTRMLVRVNPHRLHLPANAAYLDQVRAAVAQAGDRVRLVVGNDRALTLGALARADVVIVNSLSDGQNLTAFETSAVGDAVVLITPTCGASEVLGDAAIRVNPYDLVDQADALSRALRVPAAQRAEMATTLRARAAECELPSWTQAQLDLLW